MRCLVFGSSGYIGAHLVQALRSGGHEVVAHAGPRSTDASRLDLSDPASLAGIDWAVDRVFVFAGLTGTTASLMQPQAYTRANEIGLLNVLDSVRQSVHRPRVVFPSTRLVYRGSAEPLPESAPQEAKTVYAANKIACEAMLNAYARAFGLPHTVFRVCVPYGNSLGGRYSFGTIGSFIQQATDTGRIRLYGDGSLRRSFTHVDDLCRAVVEGALRDDCENMTFNVPGEDLSLLQAAQAIASRLDARIEFADWPAFDLAIESGSTVFDGSRLLARLPGLLTRRLDTWAQSITRPAPA